MYKIATFTIFFDHLKSLCMYYIIEICINLNMLLQENTEPLTHTTFTVNANTAYTTVKSIDLVSNGGSITASADKEITKPAD